MASHQHRCVVWLSFRVATQQQRKIHTHSNYIFRNYYSSSIIAGHGRCCYYVRPPTTISIYQPLAIGGPCFQPDCHFFSSKSQPTNTTSNVTNEKSDDDTVLLYQIDKDRLMRPRAAMIVSTFVLTYWTWYFVDFLPHLNSMGLAGQPSFGAIGVGTGIVMVVASCLYPRFLIHQLEYVPNNKRIRVYVHHILPWPRPSRKWTEFLPGQLTLDPSAHTTKMILNQFNGDIGRFEGHIMVKINDAASPTPPVGTTATSHKDTSTSTSTNDNSNNNSNINSIQNAFRRFAKPSKWMPFYLLEISSPLEIKSGSTLLLQNLLVGEKTITRSTIVLPKGDKPKSSRFKRRR